jgi:hypothetical protein
MRCLFDRKHLLDFPIAQGPDLATGRRNHHGQIAAVPSSCRSDTTTLRARRFRETLFYEAGNEIF